MITGHLYEVVQKWILTGSVELVVRTKKQDPQTKTHELSLDSLSFKQNILLLSTPVKVYQGCICMQIGKKKDSYRFENILLLRRRKCSSKASPCLCWMSITLYRKATRFAWWNPSVIINYTIFYWMDTNTSWLFFSRKCSQCKQYRELAEAASLPINGLLCSH